MRLKNEALVFASPEEVFERVTGYPVTGRVMGGELQDKYGNYLFGSGPSLTFQEGIGEGTTWECLFEPPHRRTMRTVDSTWSDRIDQFVATLEGTLWEITWEVKRSGAPALIKWLGYRLFTGRTIWQRMVEPVLCDLNQSSRAQYDPYTGERI